MRCPAPSTTSPLLPALHLQPSPNLDRIRERLRDGFYDGAYVLDSVVDRLVETLSSTEQESADGTSAG